jgi:hypothetical protein
MKRNIILSIFILVALVATFSYIKLNSTLPGFVNVTENGPVSGGDDEVVVEEEAPPSTSLRAEKFVGTLEEVNVGCFADGICSVQVDGKNVIVLQGWSQNIVGSITGVDGIGGLESFIGDEVEVYAQYVSEGQYTLYGDVRYYAAPVDSGTVTLKINEKGSVFGVTLTPLEILEDSRCPIDVQCIQAGTLRVLVIIETSDNTSEQELAFNEVVNTEDNEITLVQVNPITDSSSSIDSSEYTLTFKIKSI